MAIDDNDSDIKEIKKHCCCRSLVLVLIAKLATLVDYSYVYRDLENQDDRHEASRLRSMKGSEHQSRCHVYYYYMASNAFKVKQLRIGGLDCLYTDLRRF